MAAPAMADASPGSGATPEAAKVIAQHSSEATSYVPFRHPQPVSVANGFSLSIPIVGRAFEAHRLALYQQGTRLNLDDVRE